jgi:hypothetical protein
VCNPFVTPRNAHKYSGNNDLRAEKRLPKLDVGGSNPLARCHACWLSEHWREPPLLEMRWLSGRQGGAATSKPLGGVVLQRRSWSDRRSTSIRSMLIATRS